MIMLMRWNDIINIFNLFIFIYTTELISFSILVMTTLNIQLLCQFFIKYNNQRQFRNPHMTSSDKQIPKLSQIVKFDE